MDFELAGNGTNLGSLDNARETFKKLTFQYLEPVWQTALLWAGNENRAAELAQEAYSETYKTWQRPGSIENIRLSIFKSLAAIISRSYQQDWRRFEPVQPIETNQMDRSDLMMQFSKISCRALGEVLSGLREDIRFIAILSLRWGFTYTEISEMLEISLSEVRSRMFIGRHQLHEKLVRNLIQKTKSNILSPNPN
jgi:DNA-directed RNA polymerase specialized sigma24 family protein